MHSGCCIASIEHARTKRHGYLAELEFLNFFLIRLSAPALFGFFFCGLVCGARTGSGKGKSESTKKRHSPAENSSDLQRTRVAQHLRQRDLLKKRTQREFNRPQVNLGLSLLDHDKQLDGAGAKSGRRGLRHCAAGSASSSVDDSIGSDPDRSK